MRHTAQWLVIPVIVRMAQQLGEADKICGLSVTIERHPFRILAIFVAFR
jgi:hypothetical protein